MYGRSSFTKISSVQSTYIKLVESVYKTQVVGVSPFSQ